jgi:pyruvate/2-oxoglutarate dehydrogenase complex dihydrolipoamide acyltransferase (E2) component
MRLISSQTDRMFRQFQIQKFDRRLSVPGVTMNMNVDATRLLELRQKLNQQSISAAHITVTHMVMKAVANALVEYPVLYSFFNGSKIIDNPELILNIPVDIEKHVDYLIIRRPDAMTLSEITKECEHKLKKIHQNEGEFLTYLENMQGVPFWIRKLVMRLPGTTINFLREHYGNFVISNFGSFHVSQGSLAISQPLIASLCIGKISSTVRLTSAGQIETRMILPLSIVFDHRAVDGAYVGRFLCAVKELLETPENLIDPKIIE